MNYSDMIKIHLLVTFLLNSFGLVAASGNVSCLEIFGPKPRASVLFLCIYQLMLFILVFSSNVVHWKDASFGILTFLN